ncbi:MAG: hypothetical protein M1308_10750 [Actinobacteria bacterium]|nr:hypothetical protein [Actinomycetota bacterium]
MFYYFDLPLIIIGAYFGIKRKISYLYLFYLWFLIIFFVGSIIKSVPNGTRTYIVVIPLVAFSAYGMYVFLETVMSIKNQLLKKAIIIFFLAFIIYSYIFYLTSYFIRFPVEYAKEWRSEDQKTVGYIKSIEGNYKKIIFDDNAEFFYTSLLFYGKYPPDFYQKNAVYRQNGLVNTLVKVGKYEFRKVDWKNETPEAGTLFITGKDNIPPNKEPLAVFTYPVRPVVIYYDRKIGQFPVTDIAYKIFELKETKHDN